VTRLFRLVSALGLAAAAPLAAQSARRGATEGLLARWLDTFGAAYSIPHATADARGDSLRLWFPYSTGAFRDTFIYAARTDAWHFKLEAAASAGGWRRFAEYDVRRSRDPAPGTAHEED
jgi:hypothetical protein